MNLAGVNAQIEAIENLLAFDLNLQILDFQERHPRNPFTHFWRLLASPHAPAVVELRGWIEQGAAGSLRGFAWPSVAITI